MGSLRKGGFKLIVTFYQTDLSDTDRCYDSQSYTTYLNSLEKQYTLNLPDVPEIIPNVLFYLDLAVNENYQDILKCNYMTFNYNGIKYGAFIDSIDPYAFNRKFRIIHHVDMWYMAQTLYKDTLDFHGQCIRAHVNEIDNPTDTQLRANFLNTYNTPEETFSTKDIEIQEIPLTTEDNDRYYSWIYLYINNPSAIQFSEVNLFQRYIGSEPFQEDKVLQGVLLCGILNKFTGDCYFYFNDADKNIGIELNKLTSQYITVMYISNIPPTNSSKATYANNHWYPTSDDGDIRSATISNSEGLPSKVSILFRISIQQQSNILDNFTGFNENSVSNLDKEDYITCDYNKFINNYIFKLFTSAYNPAYIGNSLIDTTELHSIQIKLSPEGSIYWITPTLIKQFNNTFVGDYDYKRATTITINNFYQFAPDTVKDYWTDINAKRSILATEQKRFGSIMQGISAVLGFESDMVGGAMGLVGGALTGNAQSAISGGLTIANAPAKAATGIGNSVYGVQDANLAGQIANQQYRSGIGTKDVTTGYYGSMLDHNSPTILWYKQNENSLKNIAVRLHRYGYNTFLQIDDIYKNHRRRHFNYIRCPNIEVHGVPTNIANEIGSMFAKGVHLWTCIDRTDKVSYFEVNNHEMSVEQN